MVQLPEHLDAGSTTHPAQSMASYFSFVGLRRLPSSPEKPVQPDIIHSSAPGREQGRIEGIRPVFQNVETVPVHSKETRCRGMCPGRRSLTFPLVARMLKKQAPLIEEAWRERETAEEPVSNHNQASQRRSRSPTRRPFPTPPSWSREASATGGPKLHPKLRVWKSQRSTRKPPHATRRAHRGYIFNKSRIYGE